MLRFENFNREFGLKVRAGGHHVTQFAKRYYEEVFFIKWHLHIIHGVSKEIMGFSQYTVLNLTAKKSIKIRSLGDDMRKGTIILFIESQKKYMGCYKIAFFHEN